MSMVDSNNLLAESETNYLVSPFGPGAQLMTPVLSREDSEVPLPPGLMTRSPFSEAMSYLDADTSQREDFDRLLGELQDEEFEDAVRAVANEAAARHIKSMDPWSEMEEGGLGGAETWVSRLASEADRVLESLEAQFGSKTPAEASLEDFERAAGLNPNEGELIGDATEQFLGGLVRKAAGFVSKAAKFVGNIAMGPMFAVLRKLVRPLLIRALNAAINKLPVSLRPMATQLRYKLLGGRPAGTAAAAAAVGQGSNDAATGAAAAPDSTPNDATPAPDPVGAAVNEFDEQLASAMLAPSAADLNEIVAEAEAEALAEGTDPLHELDQARERLERDLSEATPGVPPQEALEQFFPAVMAAMPLIRTAFKVLGRQRVINFVAPRLAVLIKGYVGPAAANQLSRHLADAGLRTIGLEAAVDRPRPMEAMVATLEETMRQVALLPASAMESPLRLEAELQEAFTAAAAANLPAEMLRDDLVGDDNEHSTWTMMPRLAMPSYRYKKYGRVFPVSITRPMARTIVFAEGESLETRLLDAGVHQWPVQSEVHLYEGMPGAQLGHLAAFETEDSLADSALSADEFEELTPQNAAVLLGRPGLGRTVPPTAGRTFATGQRMFRIEMRGGKARRRRPRLIVSLDGTAKSAALKIHLRLRERESHEISRLLDQKAHVQVTAMFRNIIGPVQKASLAHRFIRHSGAKLGKPLPSPSSDRLAAHVAEAMVTTIAKELPAVAAQFASATRDPAMGTTLTFVFPSTDVYSAVPGVPTVSIRPGWRRA